MSGKNQDSRPAIELAGEELFHFAINREDIKSLIAHLPEGGVCKPETVEYELQLLRIISTGWAISFFLENTRRERLAEIFWKSTYEFSATLSETTSMMTGNTINYFNILKDRLDRYIQALSEKSTAAEPAAVIGPEFARLCGDENDIFAVMTGSRMFKTTVAGVKEYLSSLTLQ